MSCYLKHFLGYLFLGVFICQLLAAITVAANFYVAPTGKDSNCGSEKEPFATLSQAQAAVSTFIAKGLREDVTVFVRDGTYHREQPLTFGLEDSGTKEFKVTYVAYPGEMPLISGGRKISGWSINEAGLWETTIPEVAQGTWDFRELFVNGKRRPRCRNPNNGFLRVTKVIEGRRSFQFAKDEIPKLSVTAEPELVLLHDWSVSRNQVRSIDFGSNILETVHEINGNLPFFRIDGFEPHPRYWLENHPAFLDIPGEWYLDKHSGTLTYFPLDDEQPEKAEVIAPFANQLLLVRGGGSPTRHPVRNLHFVGLKFEHTNWLFDASRYGGVQAGFHWSGTKKSAELEGLGNPIPAAIDLEFVEGCSLRCLIIAHLGGTAIRLHENSKQNTIKNCHIYDVSANGIMIGEQAQDATGPFPAETPVSQFNHVKNNLVEQCGQQFYGAVGIWLGITNGNRVLRNEVRHLPYTGISIGWRWNTESSPCKKNIVADNHIHHVMHLLSDGAGIYTLGHQPGTILRRNWIHDIPENVGTAESNGIFCDQGTSEIFIHQNLIHGVDRSPLRFHRAKSITVSHNILVYAPEIPASTYNNTDPADICMTGNQMLSEIDFNDSEIQQRFCNGKLSYGIQRPYRVKLQHNHLPLRE